MKDDRLIKNWRVSDRFVVVSIAPEWEVQKGARGTVTWVGRDRLQGTIDGGHHPTGVAAYEKEAWVRDDSPMTLWPDDDQIRHLDPVELLAELA